MNIWQEIDGWFKEYTHVYNTFIKALMLGDIDAMNTYMNRVALATFSSFDAGKKPQNDCRNLQTMVQLNTKKNISGADERICTECIFHRRYRHGKDNRHRTSGLRRADSE